ncbi:rifin [Plasmodium reichenowi]|uniref:Rifin n=1 Tax=Plasmodium reichenowi TaxID=5854 RepID=A0A060RT79_PLARE|nr:rifin [Plasmodium reichenowi]
MKLHCSKILLLFLPLNILVASHLNNLYIRTPYAGSTTSRMLSEGDTQSSNYDHDPQMKKVMNNFNRQTSQRLRKYDERMQDKRQKRKEQREENIEKIIENDKREKSLAEKVEKGCLKCGCGLGGVAASVGLFGGLGIYGWKTAAIAAAKEAAIAEVAAAGEAAHIPEIIKEVIAGITKEFRVSIQGVERFESLFTVNTYPSASEIARAINSQYDPSSCLFPTGASGAQKPICTWVTDKYADAMKIQATTQGNAVSMNDVIKNIVETIVSNAESAATEKATATLTEQKTAEIAAACMGHQTAIIASVVTILVIVLVMVIIYLVLRYRRKKKMKKKAQYTKLLNQ